MAGMEGTQGMKEGETHDDLEGYGNSRRDTFRHGKDENLPPQRLCGK
jgi:hypothetical protein